MAATLCRYHFATTFGFCLLPVRLDLQRSPQKQPLAIAGARFFFTSDAFLPPNQQCQSTECMTHETANIILATVLLYVNCLN